MEADTGCRQGIGYQGGTVLVYSKLGICCTKHGGSNVIGRYFLDWFFFNNEVKIAGIFLYPCFVRKLFDPLVKVLVFLEDFFGFLVYRNLRCRFFIDRNIGWFLCRKFRFGCRFFINRDFRSRFRPGCYCRRSFRALCLFSASP